MSTEFSDQSRNSFPIEEFNLSIRLLFKKKRYICFIIKP